MRLQDKFRPGAAPSRATTPADKDRMRVGVALPRFGELASASSIGRIAQQAERLGFDNAWLLERGSEGEFDPLTLAAYLAGRTKSLGFGVWWDSKSCSQAAALRQVRSASSLSAGRLTVAVAHPAGYYDETPAFQSPARLIEVAAEPHSVPVAGAAVVARCQVTFQAVEGPRPRFTGSFAQIAEDINAYRRFDVAEVIVDFAYSASVARLDDYLMHMEQLAREVGGFAPSPEAPGWPGDSFDWLT